MDLVRIHECLCDRTRLRVIHLLLDGPLCVCHLQEILREPQVKVSRHLAYLRERGMVTAERRGQWKVYGLPARRPRALDATLACLQDCCAESRLYREDARRLAALKKSLAADCPQCVRTSARRTAVRL